jgi:hypothetical protein
LKAISLEQLVAFGAAAYKIAPDMEGLLVGDKSGGNFRMMGFTPKQEYAFRVAIPNLPTAAARIGSWGLGYILGELIDFWDSENEKDTYIKFIPKPGRNEWRIIQFAVEAGWLAQTLLEQQAAGSPAIAERFRAIRKALEAGHDRGLDGKVNPYTQEGCAKAAGTPKQSVSPLRIRQMERRDNPKPMPRWIANKLAKHFSEHSGVEHKAADFYPPATEEEEAGNPLNQETT